MESDRNISKRENGEKRVGKIDMTDERIKSYVSIPHMNFLSLRQVVPESVKRNPSINAYP